MILNYVKVSFFLPLSTTYGELRCKIFKLKLREHLKRL